MRGKKRLNDEALLISITNVPRRGHIRTDVRKHGYGQRQYRQTAAAAAAVVTRINDNDNNNSSSRPGCTRHL